MGVAIEETLEMTLYIDRIHSFKCDEDQCTNWSPDYRPNYAGRSQIQSVRKQAEADGWSFEPARRRVFPYFVRCPAHTLLRKAEP